MASAGVPAGGLRTDTGQDVVEEQVDAGDKGGGPDSNSPKGLTFELNV